MDKKNLTSDEIRALMSARKKAEKVDDDAQDIDAGSEIIPIEIDEDFIWKCIADNQVGDARLYNAINAGAFIFVKKSGIWYAWDGHRWEPDDQEKYIDAVANVVRVYKQHKALFVQRNKEVTMDKEDEKRYFNTLKKIQSRIDRLQSRDGIKSCCDLVHCNKSPMAVKVELLDADPWLLGVENGVIDLRYGTFGPGKRTDYITKRCNAKFVGLDKVSEIWKNTLNEIFNENEELIKHVQKIFGYFSTALMTIHLFVMFYGEGRNGKGLIIETIMEIMGDYAIPIAPELLLDQKWGKGAGSATPELMSMIAARIAFASETKEGAKFDLSSVKRLTGANKLVARSPHSSKEIHFRQTAKICMDSNHMPHMSLTKQYAFAQRLHLITFPIKYLVDGEPVKDNERKADTDLPLKVLKDKDKILSWIILGCLMWQDEGLKRPKCVLLEGKKYIESEAHLEIYRKHCLELTGSDVAKIRGKEFYQHYLDWVEANEGPNAFKIGPRKFGEEMSMHYDRTMIKGVRNYLGVKLKDIG